MVGEEGAIDIPAVAGRDERRPIRAERADGVRRQPPADERLRDALARHRIGRAGGVADEEGAATEPGEHGAIDTGGDRPCLVR